MTLQTCVNDMANSLVRPSLVRLLVLDEAHKAAGNHAYVKLFNRLADANAPFRLLALSATPGNSLQVRASCPQT